MLPINNRSSLDSANHINRYTKVDLHSHSTCSDGSFSPSELLNKAFEVGIDVFALTDHDTLAGINEAKAVADEHGIHLINGVEISVMHQVSGGYGKHSKHKLQDKIIHVLALDFADTEKMGQALARIQSSRANRGEQIVQKLATLIEVPFAELWQEVLAHADSKPEAVGRVHIAKVLVEREHVPTVQKAFDKFLADNKPAYVAIESLSMAEAITLIHDCGGVAVLAHPTRYGLSATRVRKLISDFAEMGGDACELPSNDEPISKRQMIDRQIAEHGLKVSVGSDFHGANMPWRRLGDVPKLNENQTLVLTQKIDTQPTFN